MRLYPNRHLAIIKTPSRSIPVLSSKPHFVSPNIYHPLLFFTYVPLSTIYIHSPWTYEYNSITPSLRSPLKPTNDLFYTIYTYLSRNHYHFQRTLPYTRYTFYHPFLTFVTHIHNSDLKQYHY